MKTPVACIDVGTHTARLLIAHVGDRAQSFRPLLRRRIPVRLAMGTALQDEQRIASPAAGRAIAALERFQQDIRTHGAAPVLAVATGLVRDAENASEFLAQVSRRTGIELRIVSGEEEALLSARGALRAVALPSGRAMVMDLGGGSTEFYLGGQGPTAVWSVPIGAAVLTRTHLPSDPPDSEALAALSRYVVDTLRAAGLGSREKTPSTLIGTGGTVTALAALNEGLEAEQLTGERLNGRYLPRAAVEAWVQRLAPLPATERMRAAGLGRGRAEVIVAGAVTVRSVLDLLGLAGMTVSFWDLLEGLLFQLAEGEHDG